ncbi:helix-turn-helix domain containing protein [Nonomuraea sp. MCN248]|uniref:Helix-turn-helix domain containing protein n=1 Tax=Nonomuraea corallina TaxID=2989783 RepID=A0ABT4SL48_9ACTN|nr:TetR/AcrR family transcriptional regulator [Nonomuraea corallina]MDA0637631.1 helix-turn-helix domain containing protein [Nonomuraea corallina]
MARPGRPPQDPARHLERAHRILDAAAELILRWGYDKTTIEDVARAADVAKGTIYLHWRTRDALFGALLRRDRVRMVRQVREAGPRTLPDLVGALAAALQDQPLTWAAMVGDSQVLGRLTRQKFEAEGPTEFATVFRRYLDELAGLGAVRADLGAEERPALVMALLYGFLVPQAMRPEDQRLPDGRVTELIADAAGRVLGTGAPPGPEVAEVTRAFLADLEEIACRRLAGSLGPDGRAL